MTVAEAKVKELCEKLLGIIDGWRATEGKGEDCVFRIEAYLSGMCDGIDFAEEMRQPDMSVQAKTDEPRPVVGDGPCYTISGGPNLCDSELEKAPEVAQRPDPRIEINDSDLPWNMGRTVL